MSSMRKNIILKVATIFVISIIISYVLYALSSIVNERKNYAINVINEIKNSNYREQIISAPFIYIPIKKDCTQLEDNLKNKYSNIKIYTDYQAEQLKNEQEKVQRCKDDKSYYSIIATKLDWNNNIDVKDNVYKRGLYNAINYKDDIQIKGSFNIDFSSIKLDENEILNLNEAKIIYMISDLRGVTENNILNINNEKRIFEIISLNVDTKKNINTNNSCQDEYCSSPAIEKNNLEALAINIGDILQNNINTENKTLDFTLDSSVLGIEEINFIPIGYNVNVKVESNWPHPNFSGNSLPQSRNITKNGFTAKWQNNYLTNKNNKMVSILYDGHYNELNQFNIKMQEPINIYSQTDRALKYAMLFIIITYGCLFLFTTIKKIEIHPIQYLLVGVAQAMFYLILLSFSEIIDFGLAYLGASIACIGLISYYISYILKSFKAVITLTISLITMYFTLYILLNTETYTLILGTSFVFILLVIIMVTTRKIDWYNSINKKP